MKHAGDGRDQQLFLYVFLYLVSSACPLYDISALDVCQTAVNQPTILSSLGTGSELTVQTCLVGSLSAFHINPINLISHLLFQCGINRISS